MGHISQDLASHPDAVRWNARYGTGWMPDFIPRPLAVRALAMPPADGPVLDLACGPSGAALLAAAAGRPVTAVDVSEVALDMLAAEARRRGLDGLITTVHADLGTWTPGPARFAVVLCTRYWDRAVFAAATQAVEPGGLLGWEAFTQAARRDKPQMPLEWSLAPGEPASLLPAWFDVLSQEDLGSEPASERLLLARRRPA